MAHLVRPQVVADGSPTPIRGMREKVTRCRESGSRATSEQANCNIIMAVSNGNQVKALCGVHRSVVYHIDVCIERPPWFG